MRSAACQKSDPGAIQGKASALREHADAIQDFYADINSDLSGPSRYWSGDDANPTPKPGAGTSMLRAKQSRACKEWPTLWTIMR